MQQNEKLSAYIDNELKESNFTEALCSSAELQKKWQNYHTIRSIMRGDEVILKSDFSLKIEQLLENEKMEIQPNKFKKDLKIKRWIMPITQLGIAASVCFMVVTGINVMKEQNSDEYAQEQPILQTLPFTNSVQPISLNLQEEIQKIEDEKKKQEELKKEQKELDKVQQQ